jgi:FAD/FMN-containing dehydrogenase
LEPVVTVARGSSLDAGFRGQLLGPLDAGYDEARGLWNARVDRRPALIARCWSPDDVRHALAIARRARVAVSVKSGGHHVAGAAVADHGLVIDLSRLKRIEVLPERRLARAEAGVLWGELDAATGAHGLATTGARVSTVGIAGVTLGGGYGWLMRQHGLTVDNVRAIEVVTAGGRALRASADSHGDLYWGLRGGGALAVATEFEYRLHPVGAVTCGVAFYPIDDAADVLRWYRRRMAAAPDALTITVNLIALPPAPFIPTPLHGVDAVGLAIAHFGDPEQARADLASLSDLGPPLAATLKPRSYTAVQRMFDAAGARGNCVCGRAGHLHGLDDALIDALARVRLSSTLSAVMVAPLGGAVARVSPGATAYQGRAAAYDFAADAVWPAGTDAEPHLRWLQRLWSAVAPFTAGAYVNELGADEHDRLRAAYGPVAYDRLTALRAAYDPDALLGWWLPQ